MNDEARELLVKAALEGHPQAHSLHRLHEVADCAIGILHIARHANRDEAVRCWHETHVGACILQTQRYFGISSDEGTEIRQRNDHDGWDFLTIARKFGRGEPV